MTAALPKTPAPGSKDDDWTEIAKAVRATAAMAKKMTASGLSQRAIVLLIQDATRVSQRDIIAVLNALPKLADWALKPEL